MTAERHQPGNYRRQILIVAATAALIALATERRPLAQNAPQVAIDADDIGGIVTGANGPEAGVWVIAETTDLKTKFRKIVVTDAQGRYVLPDLPNATYQVWVRGYGLIDSAKQTSRPGRRLNHRAVVAPDAAKAAQIYPANYWLSLLNVPPASAFPMPSGLPAPGAGRGGGQGQGQGTLASQAAFVQDAKSQIIRYQYGGPLQRSMHPGNPTYAALGLKTTAEVLRYVENTWQVPDFWPGRSQPVFDAYVDWIERIRKGAVPQQAPPRPQGVERNLVITEWDVANDFAFVHDIASSDRRNPTVNAHGQIYGLEFHTDQLVILDPLEHRERMIPIPSQVDKNLIPTFTRQTFTNPSPIFGGEVRVEDHARPNHLVLDEKGRVWTASRIAAPEPAEYCRAESNNVYARRSPATGQIALNIAMFDPRTEKWDLIRTCFGGQHLAMAVDGTNRVFQSSNNATFGWIDMDVWDKTHDQEKSQGWCRLYFDGDRNFPIAGAPYGPAQSRADGSIWGAIQEVPGRIIRLSLGANPPETCVGEMYEVPFSPTGSGASASGFFSRGIDVDSQGVVWTGLAGSGHLASFDRRLCKGPLSGEAARTGRHCPEGWKLYATPGPRLGNSPFSADFHYYNFIDHENGLGLGRDTAIVNGTNSDSMLVLNRATGDFITLRVPYPLGFYTRGMDVRIDDPKTGWKGRALWATNGTRSVWDSEIGPGDRGRVFKMQMRPDPLAK